MAGRFIVQAVAAHVADDADDLARRSVANCGMTPFPIQIFSFSGSPLGQKRLAIAWLMITTGGAARCRAR